MVRKNLVPRFYVYYREDGHWVRYWHEPVSTIEAADRFRAGAKVSRGTRQVKILNLAGFKGKPPVQISFEEELLNREVRIRRTNGGIKSVGLKQPEE